MDSKTLIFLFLFVIYEDIETLNDFNKCNQIDCLDGSKCLENNEVRAFKDSFIYLNKKH